MPQYRAGQRRSPAGIAPAPPPAPGHVNAVLRGDCVPIMRSLPAGAYDTAFVDPPFNIGYAYDAYDDARPKDEYLGWCAVWLDLCVERLTPEGTLWLAIGQNVYPDVDVLARRAGLHRRSTVIWHYTFGVACTGNFAHSYTNLAYYTRNRTRFHFDPDAVRVPSARQAVYGDKRANPAGKLPDDVWFYRPQELPEGLPADGDVWHAPRVAGTFHARQDVPTHMPEQVVARCLKVTTPTGGLVLDLMAGSGTTSAVCKKLGMRYTAIELSADCVAKMGRRLEGVKEGDPLDGPKIQD